MTIKLVFEKETYRLLGAQIVGYEGVDKRIDVLAVSIHAGLKATQLKDLELAYALHIPQQKTQSIWQGLWLTIYPKVG